MPRLAANITLLFNEVPFLERFARAAGAGFRGVECQFPYQWQPAELARRLRDNGLEQVLFNLPAGDWERGERGIAALPGREAEFRAGVEKALAYADALGCVRLNCLAGLAPRGLPVQELMDTLAGNLDWAAGQLAAEGRTLMVEAINSKVDVPGFLLDSSAAVIALIERLGRTNVRLQYDIYHMQIMEGDILRTLETHLDRIGHIQFADNPGRHEPGTGELNFPRIFSALDNMGYAGWVSAEYHPRGDTGESLAALAGWLAG